MIETVWRCKSACFTW